MRKVHQYFTLIALMLSASCTKDGGFYEPEVIDKEFKGTTYEYLKSKPGTFDSLLIAIDRVGATDLLSDSNVTLFAVANPGFQLALTNLNNLYALSEKPSQYLTSIDYAQLDTMMSQYIIRGSYPTDSLRQQDGLQLSAVRFGYPMHGRLSRANASGYVNGGPELIQFSDTKGSQFTRDWISAATTSINIKTKNGYVHVLSADHVFGFEDFIKRLTFNPPPPNLFSLVGGTQTVSRESGGGANGVEGSNNLLDGNSQTKLFVNWDPKNFTVTYELAQATAAGAYTITSANDAEDRDPADWNLQGSLDNDNWVTLDTRTNQVFEERFQQKVFRFSNTVAYKFYRLNIVRNNGSTGMQFADWTVNLAK